MSNTESRARAENMAQPALKFGCFVTGTDTDVGKTLIASALLHLCAQQGWRSLAMKPVAAGCTLNETGQWRNADVDSLMAAANVSAELADINPYRFKAAIAPHLAARHENNPIQPAVLHAAYQKLRRQADALIVEGAGGFMVPLNEDYPAASQGNRAAGYGLDDFAAELQLPVILVVGMRLGCLNHALLTQAAIHSRGLQLAGWVANRIDPEMNCFAENLATLQIRLHAPLLGVVPHLPQAEPKQAAACLDIKNAKMC